MKISFASSSYSFEIEGGIDEILSNIDKLHSKFDILYPEINSQKITNDAKKQNDTRISSFPSLQTIALKKKDKTEVEWIILCAFYKSKFGENSFTREDITEAYTETKRKTASNMKNLAANIKSAVKKNFFDLYNDTEIIITTSGIELAKEIIGR